jgi:hypothetical protein
MFGYLDWMGVPLVLLTALGCVGYVAVVLRCTEEEFRKEPAAGRADEMIRTEYAGETSHRPARRAA